MSIKISKEQAKEVLAILDKALHEGPWQTSNFLKSIGKNLQTIRNDFAKKIESDADNLQKNTEKAQLAIKAGQKEIFISLYSSTGSNLQSWERILNNLPRQLISRPIYSNEESIVSIIKSKENRLNEAYVSLFINENSLLSLPTEKIPVDKLGQPLLTLKDNAITLENISRFEHQSGTYSFSNARLIRINNTSSME